jgi:DNA-binding GntR family transcriptional regulator
MVETINDHAFSPPLHKSVRGHIVAAIRKAILDGSLHQGEKLVERKLAVQFGTSLSVVREALIELGSQGFITKTPNTATIVTNFSSRSVEEVFAFRRVVEAHAVEEAARRATPEQIDRLQKLYLALHDSARTVDPVLNVQRDLSLHEMIWHMAGNECFEIALQRVLRPFFAFTAVRVIARDSFNLAHSCQLHLVLVEAIAARNPELARERFLTGLCQWQVDAVQDAGSGSGNSFDVGAI